MHLVQGIDATRLLLAILGCSRVACLFRKLKDGGVLYKRLLLMLHLFFGERDHGWEGQVRIGGPASSSRVRHRGRTRQETTSLPPVSLFQFVFYPRNLQRESFALPRATGVAEKRAAEHVHGAANAA